MMKILNVAFNKWTVLRISTMVVLTIVWFQSQNPFVLFVLFFLLAQLIFPCNQCTMPTKDNSKKNCS